MMQFFRRLERHQSTLFLILTLFGFFLLRLPSLSEPYWYGDEGIYEVIGMALRNGRFLYSGIYDNKPPLLYLIYALFSGNQEGVRLLSLLVGLVTVFIFFLFTKKLFADEKISRITTLVFGFLFATPFLEGNIANAENFMLLPIVLAGLIIFTSTTNKKFHSPFALRSMLFVSGLLLGFAFLTKVIAVFDFAAFFLFFVFVRFKKISQVLSLVPELFLLITGFLLPFLVTSFVFLTKGLFFVFIQSILVINVGYVGYANKFIIPQGFLLLKVVLLFAYIFLLFIKRKKISPSFLIIFLWFGFSLFDTFFSQRPYTHYLLVLITSLSLFLGIIIKETRFKKLLIGAYCLIILVVGGIFSLQTRVYKFLPAYYWNFISFEFGLNSVNSYYSFFDNNTPKDYAFAGFINTHKTNNTTLFVWGNDAQIYKLTNLLPPNQYTVAYHITTSKKTYDATAKALQKEVPQYILIQPNLGPIPYSLDSYNKALVIGSTVLYEKNF